MLGPLGAGLPQCRSPLGAGALSVQGPPRCRGPRGWGLVGDGAL